ncbi:MAG: hypothetical protein A2X35_04455 [Elusimicrobia bacterium GWA2_61_42]|nr:MAG: hypothetical protein A2X35_04455 [Elusimicrobia bacterium GWA2_61_42]OGR76596.1 MAG: hypothetical protein A2X38_03370 [Elusimicrobia bacterium GWC2_61_25]
MAFNLKLWPLIVLLPAAAFRIHVWVNTQPIVVGRSDTYMQPAAELLEHGSYSGAETFRRTPTYPVFLAGTLGVSRGNLRSVTLIQHLLGLATAAILMRLGVLLWGSRAAAMAAGALLAFHPKFILYERSIESELLAVFLLSLTLLLVVKEAASKLPGSRPLFAAGVIGGAAALARPELAVCMIIFPLFVSTGRGWLKPAAYFFLPFAVLVAGWMFRNLMVFDSFTLSPMGAITSLQTSGPLIDWEAPTHREFKKIYSELVKANGGSHRGGVVNTAIRVMAGENGSKEKFTGALIEAAELGKETAFRHPLRYLWATRSNFWDFFGSIGGFYVTENGEEREANLWFPQKHLLALALLGLLAAAFSARSKGLLLLSVTALVITAGSCVVEPGISRRSLVVVPLLSLFASYLCVAAGPLFSKLRKPAGL